MVVLPVQTEMEHLNWWLYLCSEGGSGDFASSAALSVTDQITAGIEMVSKKIENGKYIAYFQALRILMVRLKTGSFVYGSDQ